MAFQSAPNSRREVESGGAGIDLKSLQSWPSAPGHSHLRDRKITFKNADVSLTLMIMVKRLSPHSPPRLQVLFFASTVLVILAALFLQACGGSGGSGGGGGGGGGGNPPPAPTGLTATAGNQQVSLSWSASTGATSYNVKRGTVNGGPYTTASSPTTTSYSDTGLTNGTAYYYVVTAVNANGESGNSNQASATPASAGTPYGNGECADQSTSHQPLRLRRSLSAGCGAHHRQRS